MIVIYGTRFYGKVDNHDGQHQLTRFFHIYYVPLVPVSTMWVTRTTGQGYSGHDVKMSLRSVVAGYARVWGPVAAVGALATGSVAGAAVAVGAGALAAWSWTWRSLRGAREQRRSDFHLLAFGTRCDPIKMSEPLASNLQAAIARRWAEVSEGSSPEDVARLGATSPAQAVLAYASLRLAARLAPGAHAHEAHAASERILDAIKDTPSLEGGPYRAALPPGPPPETI
jgi:hypothetical protein